MRHLVSPERECMPYARLFRLCGDKSRILVNDFPEHEKEAHQDHGSARNEPPQFLQRH